MYSLRDVLDFRLENYTVSEAERIRYQLHKQKMTLSQLLERRDENGNDRTEEELALYHKELQGCYGGAEKEKYIRYMSKMPHKAYLELCKRLRIEPDIDLRELEEIRIWKERLEANNLRFKKRKEDENTMEDNGQFSESVENSKVKTKQYTRSSKQDIEKRQELTEGVEDIARHNVGLQDEWIEEQQELFDECIKNEFVQYAKSVLPKVLYVWHQYPQFFHVDYTSDVFFLELYTQLNDVGKTLYRDMITMYMTEQDFEYEDERTKLYTSMVQLSTQKDCVIETDIEAVAGEIFEMWGNRYFIEEFSRLEAVAHIVMSCTEDDWEVLKNYHRVQVLGSKLEIRGQSLVEYMDVALYMVADAPSMK